MTGIIIILSLVVIFVIYWIFTGNSYKVEGKQIKVRNGQSNYVVSIDDINYIYDTDVGGPSRLNDGKQIFYLTSINTLSSEIIFIKTGTDKNYVISFSNPITKDKILDKILSIKPDIKVNKEL
ncbi:hypothetical protein C8C77_12820 [Halanaerobium saccharolyticum]|uniref:Bacterial Pleckstrin homology domain-containing protein n=1 Tax=Halanaerobium saccharolyticum TaxID=43595 RepID=A0A4R7YRX1_9FIRM|nr:hypothetical protein [Halanaerobium saccharolyticum]RAK10249.1 hypothetical protein C7958_10520 [Halanaerobium saccharolyticum]TDW00461.1 hypothetical protein C8C77_12820 [Halanaerobium saccharolyticum]TDX52046.1 hypothetical protein C7956_12720 [Halanaerobium saccharolyticum]